MTRTSRILEIALIVRMIPYVAFAQKTPKSMMRILAISGAIIICGINQSNAQRGKSFDAGIDTSNVSFADIFRDAYSSDEICLRAPETPIQKKIDSTFIIYKGDTTMQVSITTFTYNGGYLKTREYYSKIWKSYDCNEFPLKSFENTTHFYYSPDYRRSAVIDLSKARNSNNELYYESKTQYTIFLNNGGYVDSGILYPEGLTVEPSALMTWTKNNFKRFHSKPPYNHPYPAIKFLADLRMYGLQHSKPYGVFKKRSGAHFFLDNIGLPALSNPILKYDDFLLPKAPDSTFETIGGVLSPYVRIYTSTDYMPPMNFVLKFDRITRRPQIFFIHTFEKYWRIPRRYDIIQFFGRENNNILHMNITSTSLPPFGKIHYMDSAFNAILNENDIEKIHSNEKKLVSFSRVFTFGVSVMLFSNNGSLLHYNDRLAEAETVYNDTLKGLNFFYDECLLKDIFYKDYLKSEKTLYKKINLMYNKNHRHGNRED